MLEKYLSSAPKADKIGAFKKLQEAYEKLGRPDHAYKTIHITGTNGKGSVAINIARGLEANGYKVGLFNSPHFKDITERISIDGIDISYSRMEKIFKENQEVLSSFYFFDLLTLIALLYFKEEGIDYAVIEVGIGGALDSTNTIDSNLAVITNISIDHVDFLGNTKEAIALQKAGIIKSSIPVIIGSKAKYPQVIEQAQKVKAKVVEVPSCEDYSLENKAIADAALTEMGMKTLEKVFDLPARFERRGNLIFDMAHNEEAFLSLQKKIQKEFAHQKIIAIWNMAKSKEVEKCLSILQSFVEEVYFYPHSNPRLLSTSQAKKLGLKEYGGEQADIILACGSIYFMEPLKNAYFV